MKKAADSLPNLKSGSISSFVMLYTIRKKKPSMSNSGL